MTRYIVILQKTFHGSPAGTTRDMVEAESEAEAIEKALAKWRAIDVLKHYGFQPFFSAPALPTDL